MARAPVDGAGPSYDRGKTPVGGLPTSVITDTANAAAKNQAFGRNYPTVSGGNDTAGLASLLTAGQTDIQLRAGTYTLDAITGIAGKSDVKIRGVGVDRTKVLTTPATGNVFDLSASSFCEISHMTIAASSQRSAGAHIFLDQGAGVCQQNVLKDLWLQSSFIGIQLNRCGLTQIEDVLIGDVNAGWGWASALQATGAAISTTVDRLKGGTAAGMSSGAVAISGASVDTFHGRDWDLASQGGTSMAGLVVQAGEWIDLTDCSIESGPGAIAVNVSAGRRVHLNGAHLLGQYAVVVSGGTGFKMVGGETVESTFHSISLQGGVDTSIVGVDVSDVGFIGGGGSGWNAIEVSAGVTDFSLIGNTLGRHDLGATSPLWGVHVNTGASDAYVITGNRTKHFTGGGTTGVSDGGSGTNKAVANNVGTV